MAQIKMAARVLYQERHNPCNAIMVRIDGGPITQVEQSEMPSILKRLEGISTGFGFPQPLGVLKDIQNCGQAPQRVFFLQVAKPKPNKNKSSRRRDGSEHMHL